MSENSASALPIAGDNAVLARRYVGALFALAEQDGLVDETVADMQSLARLWKQSAEFRFFASDPRLSVDALMKVSEEVAKATDVEKLTANFLAIVAQNRRLNLLPLMIENFLDRVCEAKGEFRAEVKAARTLSDDQKIKLASALSSALGGKVRLSVTEDPSILGGLTVKIGSQVVDASVKTKLDRLERKLKASAAA